MGSSTFGNVTLSFQGNSPILQNGEDTKVHPFYQYLELNTVIPKNGFSFNTYLRGRKIIEGEQQSFDAYYAFLQYQNESRLLNVRIGRQILSEGVNYYLADGGRISFQPAQGLEILAYAGYQNRDNYPEPEAPLISSSIYGIKLKSNEFLHSIMSLGYERIDPQDFSARNFLNLSLNRVVPFTETADFYSRAELDIAEGELSLLTAGVGFIPFRSFYINIEYDFYKPDEDRGGYLQDPIFDLFSVSGINQVKGGLTYLVNPYLKASASYSYSRYEVIDGVTHKGNLVRLGFSWDLWRQLGLKSFQGLYFMDGREEDQAWGANFKLSEEFIRGLELFYHFAYVHFKKITHQKGDGYSNALGFQYLFIRNLLLKAEIEMNDHPDMKNDTRANVVLNYQFYF